jgi:hypothetical protein
MGSSTAPIITSTSFAFPIGQYPVGGSYIEITLVFDQNVIVSGGPPSVPLLINGTWRPAPYVYGSSSTTLIFNYVLQGIDFGYFSSGKSINLNGGTIQNSSSMNAVLGFTTIIDDTTPINPAMHPTMVKIQSLLA